MSQLSPQSPRSPLSASSQLGAFLVFENTPTPPAAQICGFGSRLPSRDPSEAPYCRNKTLPLQLLNTEGALKPSTLSPFPFEHKLALLFLSLFYIFSEFNGFRPVSFYLFISI